MMLLLWIAITLGAILAGPVAFHVLVPFGRVKLAAFVARRAVPWLGQDRDGRAALAAAMALHRRRVIAVDLVAWVEARIGEAQPLAGAGGLMRAARGDGDGARALLASVAWLAPGWSPSPAAAVAHEWLAAEAASRGDWALVRDLPGPNTATGAFLRLVAARRLGEPVPDARLRAAWRRARRRDALRPLLDTAPARAPAAPPSPPPDTSPYRTAAAPDDPVAVALRAHAETIAAPTAERVRAAARAWDRALADPGLASLAAARAAALGARPDGFSAFARAVVDDLAVAALAAGGAAHAHHEDDRADGIASSGVAKGVRDRLLADVEAGADAMVRRVRDGRRLAAVDEWRELVDLRLRHARVVALGDELTRHLVFPTIHAAACPLAVAMWNAAFAWLLAEAEAAAHEGLAAHERRNVACAERL